MTLPRGAVISDSECLVLAFSSWLPPRWLSTVEKGRNVKVRVGVDVACRAAHQAACADEAGNMLWSGHRFRTSAEDLQQLWGKVPESAEVMVVMEPTRNAWVPLAAWFRRQGATVVLVPSEQSADLRAYYSKHTKTDHLDAQLLARLPMLHPDGLHAEQSLGPADPLKRAVKFRSTLVHRRTTCLARLDAMLEILGPQWTEVFGSALTKTALRFLTRWANPYAVRRLGKTRLARWLHRTSRGAWADARAADVMAAAEATLELWGANGMDFDSLAADIAVEAQLALSLTEQIHDLDERISDLYAERDPAGIVRSAPGVGEVLAAQITGRLGDVNRFTSLAAARSFSGLIPTRNASGLTDQSGGPTKHGDACLREAIFLAAQHARRIDPTLAARYHRLMMNVGKHHNSALCTVAAVLLTRLVACLRAGQPYQIRDVDGRAITEEEGKAIVAQRYQIPPEIRAARITVSTAKSQKRRDERAKRGVAERSKTTPVPAPV
jgi:transposase